MSTLNLSLIPAILHSMNYARDERLKVSLPTTQAGRPIVYRVLQEGNYVMLRGFVVTEVGDTIKPEQALTAGEVWIGMSNAVWNDYSPDGDGAPRFVVMHNRFRDRKFENFTVNFDDTAWVSCMEVRAGILHAV
jgi:hypothetical protein